MGGVYWSQDRVWALAAAALAFAAVLLVGSGRARAEAGCVVACTASADDGACCVCPGQSGPDAPRGTCSGGTCSNCPTCTDDGDGELSPECGGSDCDNSDPSIFPGATEQCDGVDNDCDDAVDEDCPCNWQGKTEGQCNLSTRDGSGACAPPPEYRPNENGRGSGDACDGLDNDCDGATDEGCSCNYANKTAGVCGGSYIGNDGNCTQPAHYQSNESACDLRDNDCDGVVDEGCPCDYNGDPDGVCGGLTRNSNGVCPRPSAYQSSESSCDGKDNDCDGAVDEDCGSCDTSSCGGSCGSWGSCTGFSDTCDETGTRPRTCDTAGCSGDSCTTNSNTDHGACQRNTDGQNCGNDGWYDVGAPYACCDNMSKGGPGQETCTCQDQEYRDFSCSSSLCDYNVTNQRTQQSGCTSCGGFTCDSFGNCDWENSCSQFAVKMGECTTSMCLYGECFSVTSQSPQQCNRTTEGDSCAGGTGTCTNGQCSNQDPCGGVTCPGGKVCDDGLCYEECSGGGSCAQGTTCVSGLCRPDPCALMTCPSGDVCHNGACFHGCSSDSDCTAGASCNTSTGTCVSGPCSGITCGAAESCYQGQCYQDCIDETNCPAGQVCVSNRCQDQDPCDTISCPSGQSCYQGSCSQSCVDSSDCATNEQCYDGACINDPCASVSCDSGEICYQGSCFGPCTTDADCGPAEACYDGRCANDACQDVTCAAEETCYQGSCAQACTLASDCPSGQSCIDGRCATDACDGVQCPGSQICEGGSCVAGCTSDADCGAGERCASTGRCLPENPCDAMTCSDGQVCYSGSCFDSCSADADCPAGQACYDGRCADGACDDVNCFDGQICYQGSCADSCASDADCSQGSCIDGRCATDACDGVQCPSEQVCRQGDCKTPCSSDADCPGGGSCSDGVCSSCQGTNCSSADAGNSGSDAGGADIGDTDFTAEKRYHARIQQQGWGCGCTSDGDGGVPLAPTAAVVVLAGLAVVRRRRR